MNNNKSNGGVGIAWTGAVVMIVGQRTDYWVLGLFIGIAITMIGCMLWVQRKKRHLAFVLWGILAPIGFLGISLLKDKSLSSKNPLSHSDDRDVNAPDKAKPDSKEEKPLK